MVIVYILSNFKKQGKLKNQEKDAPLTAQVELQSHQIKDSRSCNNNDVNSQSLPENKQDVTDPNASSFQSKNEPKKFFHVEDQSFRFLGVTQIEEKKKEPVKFFHL